MKFNPPMHIAQSVKAYEKTQLSGYDIEKVNEVGIYEIKWIKQT